MLRLVKGAYWDSEIKWAQEKALDDYPVFTRKRHTDISYMAGTRYLSDNLDCFYPMFATHNAQTLCAVREIMQQSDYEFQRLQGMGESLYSQFTTNDSLDIPCRIYAPVGDHDKLLPYLVRRLLENGSNSSFINRVHDENITPEELAIDPLSLSAEVSGSRNTAIPLPVDIYGDERMNSSGFDLSLSASRNHLQQELEQLQGKQLV